MHTLSRSPALARDLVAMAYERQGTVMFRGSVG